MSTYNPGDIITNKLEITSSRGSLDVASSFASLSIYESIFTPGMVADLVLIDTDDHLGQIKIIGDETVNMSFQVPGGVTANYKFGVQAIDGV